jgi:hypothetical protein
MRTFKAHLLEKLQDTQFKELFDEERELLRIGRGQGKNGNQSNGIGQACAHHATAGLKDRERRQL